MARSYEGPIVDVDFHHNWKKPSDVLEFLPTEWQEYAHGEAPRGPRVSITTFNVPGGTKRRDAFHSDDEPVCSDIDFVREQLLDRHNFYRLVCSFDVGGHGNVQNPYFGTAYARAANEWSAQTWLTYDERLYGVVSIALALPDEAAKEIRRAGEHPRVCSTLLAGSPLGRPYGEPVYHPVWEASAEMGLSVDIHPGPSTFEFEAGGKSTSNIGTLPHTWNFAMHHVTSLIVHGVFEKWPTTKVVIKEHGTAWLPYLMWRLDRNYETLKLESKWVKKWPSEYIREHIKLGSQPLEEMPDPNDLKKLYLSVDMEDLLCFATDYAHTGFDDPNNIVRRLPDGWARKVMCDNACEHYGWTPPPVDAGHETRLASGRV
jgi:predicted TIM-barrel fold metal-dependent hydrolase